MHWLDWLIVAVPLAIVFFIALRAQKYVKGVSDFLAAGRVAGRYVVAVAQGEAGLGLISLVAIFEMYVRSGFAVGFWQSVQMPIIMIVLLTGYCSYRYRETRAMTMGQFLEIRYNRSFRVLAAILQSISGVLNYAIFPAVGARFLIYYCGMPLEVEFLGLVIPTFGLVMAAFLSIAVLIVSLGGQITIMVTDCIQGILSYPLYAIIVVFILMKLSFANDILPVLMDRPEGMSMLNPYDISKLREFNIFYVFVGIFSMIVNKMAWAGTSGYNAAALNAHEQKMGGVLGTWRAGFSYMMILLLAVAGITFLEHHRFSDEASQCRSELASKTLSDVVPGRDFGVLTDDVNAYIETGVLSESLREVAGDVIQKDPENPSSDPMRDVVAAALATHDKTLSQPFSTIYNQMSIPVALRKLLPTGITGIFCALCIFLLISTDTTYMHSWGSIIVQDIVVPLRKTPLTPHQQLRLLRLTIAGVAVFAFLFSFFFAQVDYILMFMAITGALYMGGAGVCIVGGLYWKRGTSAGAFSGLISGSFLAVSAFIMQKIWTPTVYPWLERNGLLDGATRFFEGASSPFEPYVVWRVTPDRFPINSQETLFITIVVAISLYVVVSLLTCRRPFNMERLLHRGAYRVDGDKIVVREKVTLRTAFGKVIGINSEYTKGDKALAWSVFLYSFVFQFLILFIGTIIWNTISPWPEYWWALRFKYTMIWLPCAIGLVSSIWFTWGGIWDLRRLFRRLAEKENNVLDSGRVVGHVSAEDVERVERIEHIVIKEAHEENKK